ncbi:response regulator [Paenibacillus thalictri]|uniref:Circadian input-output histidine kinase CikA n=1 Tax=Paenibacillus thalictri TaxID=2527873 RepID=A0A4Q9DUL2_9BACL|nr:response regulator [Paenibacillus thalictri]TBL79935.1 response regulator [Paenibacillus thalictri]
MSLKTKLYLGSGVVILLMSVLCWFVLQIQSVLQHNMNGIVDRYEKARLADTSRFEISEMERRLSLMLLNKDSTQMQKALGKIQTNKDNAVDALKTLENKQLDPIVKDRLQQVYLALETHDEMESQITAAFAANKMPEATKLLEQDVKHINELLYPAIEQMSKYQDDEIATASEESTRLKRIALWTGVLLTLFTVLMSISITFWMTRTITRRLGRMVRVMNDISDGPYQDLPRVETEASDELGLMAASLNHMSTALEEHALREQQYQKEMEDESWLQSNSAEIMNLLRGIHDVSELAQVFISHTAKAIGSPYAVFYIKQSEKDSAIFERAGAYAYAGSALGKKAFRVGEGLVGQCAMSGEAISLSHVPEKYAPVQSGLGQAPPSYVLLIPVLYHGTVTAVLEFAGFTEIGELERKLISEVTELLGVVIDSVQSHVRIERLLFEAHQHQSELQSQAEELQSQAEELLLQQEELRTSNEQLEKQHKQSQLRADELELIRAELEQKAREVEMASGYKSEFLANMSHELRTPLNSLLILAQLLLENKEGTLLPKQLEFVRTIHQSGHELLHLINDILDISKVESGKMAVVPEECVLEELVEGLEKRFRPIVQKKGLEFNLSIDSDVPRTLFTDGQRLQQIVTNLLSNAAKFTEYGEVRLDIYMPGEEERKRVRNAGQASSVAAFAVSDTGIGISTEKHRLIFEAFQQADGSTSRSYGGTGLGLSISRQLAQLLGGSIYVDSEQGKGSRFTLFVPVALESSGKEKDGVVPLAAPAAAAPNVANEAGPVAALAEAVSGSREAAPGLEQAPSAMPVSAIGESLLDGKRVLIVDDDMRNVFALTTALESHGMKVAFAENGGDAIELLCKGEPVDIVLMDIMMPKIDGYEAMRAIRRMPERAELPIIALTAKAMKQDRERCLEAGASDYIGKPVQLNQLLSLIRVWLYR